MEESVHYVHAIINVTYRYDPEIGNVMEFLEKKNESSFFLNFDLQRPIIRILFQEFTSHFSSFLSRYLT